MFVDVQPIGPQGSSVGFAEVNQYFHTLFGVNMLLYSITDWLSIAVLFIMFGFAMVGLVQLIKRKSLFRVDSSILVLGGFYVLVFLAYLFFEFFVVNYRPAISPFDFKQKIKEYSKCFLWYLCKFYGHWAGFIWCALVY